MKRINASPTWTPNVNLPSFQLEADDFSRRLNDAFHTWTLIFSWTNAFDRSIIESSLSLYLAWSCVAKRQSLTDNHYLQFINSFTKSPHFGTLQSEIWIHSRPWIMNELLTISLPATYSISPWNYENSIEPKLPSPAQASRGVKEPLCWDEIRYG